MYGCRRGRGRIGVQVVDAQVTERRAESFIEIGTSGKESLGSFQRNQNLLGWGIDTYIKKKNALLRCNSHILQLTHLKYTMQWF